MLNCSISCSTHPRTLNFNNNNLTTLIFNESHTNIKHMDKNHTRNIWKFLLDCETINVSQILFFIN